MERGEGIEVRGWQRQKEKGEGERRRDPQRDPHFARQR